MTVFWSLAKDSDSVKYYFWAIQLPSRYHPFSFAKVAAMHPSSVEFRHLRSFVTVVEQGSFRAAALRLHISQPPLTRQIQQLEEALESTLLVRKARGVELTEPGRVFYKEARNLLMLREQAVTRTRLVGSGQIGRLDIGIFGSAVFDAIPRVVHTFKQQFPTVEVALHTLGRAEQLKALREHRLSLGFNRFFEDEPDLKWEAIQIEPINVALHQSHPLSKRKSLSLRNIVDEALILYPHAPRPSFIDHMLRLFKQRKLMPLDVQEADDVSAAVAMVSSGFGLTLVTDSACNLRLPDVAYIPLRRKDRAWVELRMMYRADDDSHLLEQFLQVARDLRKKLASPDLVTDATIHQKGKTSGQRHQPGLLGAQE